MTGSVVRPNGSLELPPTPLQIRTITRFCRALGIRDYLEESLRNRREARDLLFALRGELRMKGKRRRK